MQSPYTGDGLQVEAKKAGPLWVRIPSWVARETVRVTGATATWSDDYLFVAEPPVGAAVRIDFPLVEQELLLSERLHIEPIRTRLRGDEVVAMDNFGAERTFFDPYV